MKINLHIPCGSIPADFLVSYLQPPLSGASQMKLNPITDEIMNRIHQDMSLEQKIQTVKGRGQTPFVKIGRAGRMMPGFGSASMSL